MKSYPFGLFIIIIFIPSLRAFNSSNELAKEIMTYHDETRLKADIAFAVVHKAYSIFRQWFFTIIFCDFTYFENRILKFIENFDNGYPVMLLDGCPSKNTTKVKPRINKHGRTAYIITSKSLSVDINEGVVQALIGTGVFKPRRTVIFVINVVIEMDKYFYYEMKYHFLLLLSRNIRNSVLMFWSKKLMMYMYNPFLDEVIDISEHKDVKGELSKMYENLHGHELRISVFKKLFSDDEGPLNCDTFLIKTVLTSLNATCKPLVPRDGSTTGDLLENGTATGVTADLIDGYSDLELISRILKNSFYGYIDTTYPLSQDELCFLIKKSEKQSTFTTTIKLISIEMLIVFIFNVIFLTVVALLIQKLETNILHFPEKQSASEITMDLIKCYIRQTVDIKFWGPVFRCVVLIIIMYSLVIDCAIDGILISAITYPRYREDMDKLFDLYQSNETLGVHTRYMGIFNNSLSDDYYSIAKEKIETINDKKIGEIIEERHYEYAVLLKRTDSLFVSRRPSNVKNGRPLYHTMTECPLQCSIVYGLRFGSPYLPRLNKILSYLHQAGILRHWEISEEFISHHKNSKVLITNDPKEKKPLSMNHLKEVFYVLLIGLFLAAIAFVVEIVLFSSVTCFLFNKR